MSDGKYREKYETERTPGMLDEFSDEVTPLKWEYDGFNRIAARDDDDFTIIAETYIPRLALSKKICGSYRRNARLIAAAPLLLEACKLMLDADFSTPSTLWERLYYVREAVNAAAGNK